MTFLAKILIVEDSATQALKLKTVLEFEGYEVVVKNNGAHALEFLKQNENMALPDIIISDVEMPELSGYELCRLVKKYYPEICFIMVTGSSDSSFLKKSFDAGAIDYIEKTSSKLELFVRIENVLRIKNAESKLESLMDSLVLKNDALRLGKDPQNDSLTGMLARDTIFKQYNLKIYDAKLKSSDLSVILFDIEHFHSINIQYGFIKGDEVLIAVSHMLKKNINEKSIVGRFGGDQFIILLSEITAYNAFKTTQLLIEKVSNLTFKDVPELKINLYAGLSSYKNHKNDDLILAAYKLLYKAKLSVSTNIEVE